MDMRDTAPQHEPSDIQTRLHAILDEHGLDLAHTARVEAEARALAAAPGLDDPSLEDLEALPFVTIDYEHSKDLDQALHVRRDGSGWLLRYALADASWYVRPGTALFDEALRRGASFYLAHLCAPMLPRLLSEDVVSLCPGVPRRALVFTIRIDGDGIPTETTVSRARIHSKAKLAYDGVQAWCDDPSSSPLDGQPYTPVLACLRDLGEPLLRQARARGMVPFQRPEVAWEPPGPTAPGFRLVAEHRNDVERWNEQISLLCNTQGAHIMRASTEPWVQPVFRVHPHPAAARVDSLERAVAGLIRLHGLGVSECNWRRRATDDAPAETLADYLARLPAQGVPGRVHQAIQRQILHSYERSDFTPEPGPHHALGVPCYGRFTAPMREVVGIFTHKELLEHLGLERPSRQTNDEALRVRVIQAADQAHTIQRALTRQAERLALDYLFEHDLALPPSRRPARTGTVLGLTRSRLYVRLDDLPLEIKVYVTHVEAALGQRYDCDEQGLMLAPTGAAGGPSWRVGDAITLRLAGRDERRDRWQLAPLTS